MGLIRYPAPPMKPRLDAIHAALREKASAERREHGKGYFPTSLELLGVAVPDLRAIAKHHAKELRAAPPAEVLSLVRALVDAGTMEGRQVAYELLAAHRAARAALDEKTVVALGKGNDNWASVDAYAMSVAGPAWREGVLQDATVLRWARSKALFERRTALSCTVPLNMRSRGGTGDAKRTLMVAELLAGDRAPLVEKALSWALRELAPWDPPAVERFLARHEPRLGKLVLREVRRQLETGRKR